ncbi:MAG TPA: M15 family metallopeptidase [Alphaproteobacteria bacterium]|nr:M15 family metallopeptidase [Alphaproteobacteria bacterium]
MKPYRSIPIKECGEVLAPIPRDKFAFFAPHAYQALGAPYNGASPWMLRRGVLQALLRVQERLRATRPGWTIMLFDAYRPNAVQGFMVEREFAIQAKAAGFDPATLTEAQRAQLAEKVFRLWGIPSDDPKTPPPHSTGAVIDCTLADEHGREADMGAPIDENSDRSHPDYFATAQDEAGRRAHANRVLLYELMRAEGFHRATDEWWHFSQGDQSWAWHQREKKLDAGAIAVYGRADLL